MSTPNAWNANPTIVEYVKPFCAVEEIQGGIPLVWVRLRTKAISGAVSLCECQEIISLNKL
jgi:hypothetical protein